MTTLYVLYVRRCQKGSRYPAMLPPAQPLPLLLVLVLRMEGLTVLRAPQVQSQRNTRITVGTLPFSVPFSTTVVSSVINTVDVRKS